MTIRDFLDNAVARYSDSPALRFYKNNAWVTRSYSELNERVIRVASIAKKLGFKPKCDNVALMLENCPEWEEIYLSLACVGITVVPIDPKLRSREVLHILRDSGSIGIFIGVKNASVITEIASELPDLRVCVEVHGNDSAGYCLAGKNVYALEPFIAEASSDFASVKEWFSATRPNEESIASLIYTSGTTGAPKGAVLTHANFVANTDFATDAVPFAHDDDFLVILPLFHAFAFSFSFMEPLAVGACSSFGRSLKTISEDIRIIKPTTILAVPLLAEKMYAKIDAGIKKSVLARLMLAIGLGKVIGKRVKESLGGRLRVMAVGGGPTDRSVLRGFHKLGIPAVEGYGLTECAPLVSWPNMDEYVIGTVGRVLPCMQYKIVGADASGAGELLVKGPNVMKSYFNNAEATAKAFDSDGYFRTGDIVRVDKAGNIEICGRCKAMIVNREGKNIYPEEIEQVIGGCANVSQAIAVGYKISGETGEHIGLILQPNDETWSKLGVDDAAREAALRAELSQLFGARLADYKIPRKIVIRHEPFELTSTMKVRRVSYAGSLDE